MQTHQYCLNTVALLLCFYSLTLYSEQEPLINRSIAVTDRRLGWRPDQIIIQPKSGDPSDAVEAFHKNQSAKVLQHFGKSGRIQVVQLPKGTTVNEGVRRYLRSGLIEFAEPDFIVSASAAPNDPKFLDGTLWAINNYGQNGGKPHADMNATNAWDIMNSASNIIVAVVDSGIRYTHEDLAANIWSNPLDGTHGYNAFTSANDPFDDNGHGTLIAGVLGGVGNNGKGIVGAAWKVQMMGCKCLDNSGTGSDSTVIACIEFARTNGAKIINASLDSPSYSTALSNAIFEAREDGIIFVASCGNNGVNVDISPRYPACYDIDNIVSVAYTTRDDSLGYFSNFGATNVDLAVPGDQIYSTFSATDSYYYPPFPSINLAGTSFAAGYLSGAFALVAARYPAEDYHQLIARVLHGTDPLPSLTGMCVSGGRLNLQKVLSPPLFSTKPNGGMPFSVQFSCGPNRTCVVQVSSNLLAWTPILTNTTTTNWVFEFADATPASSSRYFRLVSQP